MRVKKLIYRFLASSYFFAAYSLGQATTLTLAKSMPMQINAEIKNGCILSGGGSNIDFGTIQFGDFIVNKELTAISAKNAGSIVLQCTPQALVIISLDAGAHTNSISAGRNLMRANDTTNRLTYQLYQDKGYSKVWGEGTDSKQITASGNEDILTVYAKLVKVDYLPPAGVYSDRVIVTVSY